MSKKDEAMKLVLEFAKDIQRGKYKGDAEEVITALQEALAEQPAQQKQGWGTVPVEPTVAMIDATGAVEADMREMVVADWKAMIAAASQPAQQQEPVKACVTGQCPCKSECDIAQCCLYTSPPAQRKPLTDDAKVLLSLLGAALGALQYHTEQTRPIQRTKETIVAIEHELAAHGIKEQP